METRNGTAQSLATLSIANLGESNWCVTRPQEGHKHSHGRHDRNFLMAEGVNGSSHPAQGEVSGGGASLAQACVVQGL